MARAYEAMRDKFAKEIGYDAGQSKAAAIYNSKHPKAPVTGKPDKKKATKKSPPQIMRYSRRGK